MNLLSRMTILVVVTILSGCAGMGAHKVLELKDNQKILVISSMGSEFELLHVGTTVFTNESKTLSVNEWNIDDYIEKKIPDLSSTSRFEVTSQKNSLPKNDRPIFMTSMWSTKVDFKGFDDRIFSFAKEKGYDLVLVVNSFKNEDSIFGTNQYYSGYGLYKRSFMGASRAVLFARVSLNLYDVDTQKKVTGSWKTVSKPSANHRENKLSMITSKQISKDKAVIQSLITETILDQLKQLKLL